MTKSVSLNADLNKKCDQFMSKINSAMNYESNLQGDELTFEWLDEIELACPYVDNIARNPKVTLIKEEDIVILEKAKKTSVATVKHLAKNTQNIDDIDEETDDVKPSKLLIERYEETFNTYENRFLYTLIDQVSRFVMKKEMMLDDLKIKDDKTLEYAASTIAGKEKVKIELKMSANDLTKDLDKLNKEIEDVRRRIARIKEFIMGWRRTEFFVALEKAHVPLVIPPIKKTNLLLKNPNFQVAVQLWDYLQSYRDDSKEDKDNLDTSGDNVLRGILDDAFLMNYYVMDAITASKKDQQKKIGEFAVVMIHQQLKRIISLLLDSGIKMSEEEIIDMILNLLKSERTKKVVDASDVKDRFKSEFDEYLEKARNFFS